MAGDIAEVRDIYLQPATTDDYQIDVRRPDRNRLIAFLCDERQFSRERVTAALDRAFPDTGDTGSSQPRLF